MGCLYFLADRVVGFPVPRRSGSCDTRVASVAFVIDGSALGYNTTPQSLTTSQTNFFFFLKKKDGTDELHDHEAHEKDNFIVAADS